MRRKKKWIKKLIETDDSIKQYQNDPFDGNIPEINDSFSFK